jgi:large subunit ribosomal protein L25
MPQSFEVDVTGMEIGTAVHAADLTLPSGVTLAADPEALVLHVIAAPTAEQMEAELGIPEGEAPAEAPPEVPQPEGDAGAASAGGEQSG